jgi:radical SAM protein with 4Fe4S-binding SPASM domain
LNELDTKEALKLIESVADLGAKSIVFTGGEPLMRKDLFELVGFARDHHLFAIIATNGILIDRDIAKFFKKSRVAVAINLPTLDERSSEIFTGVFNSHNARMKGLMYCLEEGVPTSVGIAVTNLNLNEIVRVIDFSREKRINCDVLATIPVGRASSSLLPPVSEYEELLVDILDRYSAIPMNAIDRASETHVSVYEPVYARVIQERRNEEFSRLCSLGNAMHVMEDGSVRSCVYMPMSFGNIRRKELATIWKEIRGSKKLAELQDPHRLKGACGECEDREICGGCRARAYAIKGDPFDEDPVCTRCFTEAQC